MHVVLLFFLRHRLQLALVFLVTVRRLPLVAPVLGLCIDETNRQRLTPYVLVLNKIFLLTGMKHFRRT
jgi:hypothetical protein